MVMENIIEGFPLAPQQRRVWALQQHGPAYLAQCAVLIEGSLKADLLRDALNQIVSRHEILRTTFHRRPGILLPIQVVNDRSLIAWREIDCRSQGKEIDTVIRSLLQSERDLSTALKRNPALQAALASLSAERYVLSLTLPGLCADS